MCGILGSRDPFAIFGLLVESFGRVGFGMHHRGKNFRRLFLSWKEGTTAYCLLSKRDVTVDGEIMRPFSTGARC